MKVRGNQYSSPKGWCYRAYPLVSSKSAARQLRTKCIALGSLERTRHSHRAADCDLDWRSPSRLDPLLDPNLLVSYDLVYNLRRNPKVCRWQRNRYLIYTFAFWFLNIRTLGSKHIKALVFWIAIVDLRESKGQMLPPGPARQCRLDSIPVDLEAGRKRTIGSCDKL